MMAWVILPGVPTAMPSAMVLPPWGSDACLHRVEHVGKAQRLHADDLDAGLERLGRHRDAGDQAAAADGHHQRVELRHGLQHLEPTVPWPAMMASSS